MTTSFGSVILVLVVNVVVAHVEIEHTLVLVRPDHGIVHAPARSRAVSARCPAEPG